MSDYEPRCDYNWHESKIAELEAEVARLEGNETGFYAAMKAVEAEVEHFKSSWQEAVRRKHEIASQCDQLREALERVGNRQLWQEFAEDIATHYQIGLKYELGENNLKIAAGYIAQAALATIREEPPTSDCPKCAELSEKLKRMEEKLWEATERLPSE